MSTRPEPPSAAPVDRLFADYAGPPASYDETLSAPGQPRKHWSEFISNFEKLGREELAVRWENGRKIIGEHGVTYNLHGDPQGLDRPWELDLVPLLIHSLEWRQLESALSQRARLLNLLLVDLYGPQRCLREGLIPPALIFANPGFLRACHGVSVPRQIYLHLHAADLGRSINGQWWVLGDRTQAPSGSGYALENRIVLSRILPDEFRDSRVHRLASFFRVQRETLRQLAPGQAGNPHIVLLTPGPHHESYFEHAYLARYLGFTLVEGGDLTVRNQRVFLKTVDGLQRVDIILRGISDTLSDPLELQNDSFLGVPGLVEAARSGHVAIANALGAGLVESAAFLAFLPSLCRMFLGEDLLIPSVATWWCGHARELQYVVEHLDDILIKPAFNHHSFPAVAGRELNARQRRTLIETIRARPYEFVGQEQVNLSTAPVWTDRKLEPGHVSIRVFAAAHGDGHTIMPGGLTRVSASPAGRTAARPNSSGSKDTWILSDGPVAPISLLTPTGQPASLPRSASEVPSRVADNSYWLGRYIERLEDTLRMLRSVINRLTAETPAESNAELTALVRALTGLELLPATFTGRVPLKDLEQEILALVYQPQRAGSVRELVLRIRRIMSIVRDRFSADTWRILNQLQSDSRTRPGRIPMANALALINTLIVDLAAFSGMEMENMTRGHGWRFLDFGRRLERATNLVNLIRASLAGETKTIGVLEPLLEIADSSITYSRRFLAQPELGSVLDLLLLDPANPRSLAFQIQSLSDHASRLPHEPNQPGAPAEGRRLGQMAASLQPDLIRELAASFGAGKAEPLDQWLAEFKDGLAGVSDELTDHYFTLTVTRLS